MTVTRGFHASARLLAMLFAAALVLAALPLGVASAQDDDPEIDGTVEHNPPEPGDPEDEDDDGMIASTRFRGNQRFATAALVATETWEQSDRAIIARQDDWPDALAGGYLAGLFEAPVLLISQNNIQDDTRAALQELDVSEVTILGGVAAISEDNEEALTDLGYEVDRIGGETRFETAAMVASQGEVGEIDGQRTAFVATGLEFADALTAGPLAYDGNFPILLTPSQSLHESTEEALVDLEIDKVVLLGGANAISSDVEDEIREVIEADDDEDVERLSGPTRIETAATVAGFAVADLGFSPRHHGWARGNEFADALTIGPRLGEAGGPLLLVPTPTVVDSSAGTNEEFAMSVACDTAMIDIAGGSAAVSEESENTLRSWLACPGQPLLLGLEAEPESQEVAEQIDVTATLLSNVGEPIDGETVEFEAEGDFGAQPVVNPPQDDTDDEGHAETQVTSPTPGQVHVTATVTHDLGDGEELVLTSTVTVEFTIAGQTSAFLLDLSSENEVGTGAEELDDPPVTGRAAVWLNSETGDHCWWIQMDETEHDIGSYEAIGPPNSHIHVGAPGENGDVIVPLGQVQDDTRMTADCATHPTPDDLVDIEADPAGYYVNVHSEEFPGGVARGQLAEPDDDDNGNGED